MDLVEVLKSVPRSRGSHVCLHRCMLMHIHHGTRRQHPSADCWCTRHSAHTTHCAAAVVVPEVDLSGAKEVQPGLSKQRLLKPDSRFSNSAAPATNLPGAMQVATAQRPPCKGGACHLPLAIGTCPALLAARYFLSRHQLLWRQSVYLVQSGSRSRQTCILC